MYQGKVKWFNNAKGYGFIVEDGCTDDLFAHFSSIQMDGYKTLKAGQSVTFDKQPSNKGIHAVNISSIEVASPDNANTIDNEIISVEEQEAPTISASTPEKESAQQEAKSPVF
jgi:CspA family cold shock protein